MNQSPSPIEFPPELRNPNLTEDERCKVLFESARLKRYLPFVTQALTGLKPAIVKTILGEIQKPGRSAQHRANLVEVIGELGHSLDIDDMFLLANHRSCQSKTVRNAISNLIDRLEAKGQTLEGNPTGYRCPDGPRRLFSLFAVQRATPNGRK